MASLYIDMYMRAVEQCASVSAEEYKAVADTAGLRAKTHTHLVASDPVAVEERVVATPWIHPHERVGAAAGVRRGEGVDAGGVPGVGAVAVDSMRGAERPVPARRDGEVQALLLPSRAAGVQQQRAAVG